MISAENNTPAGGALIQSGIFSAITDSNGEYSFEIFAGTHDISCSVENYVTEVIENVVVEDGETIIVDFFYGFLDNKSNEISSIENVLGSNYLNPFNPTTTIEFSLSETGLTNLSVYNLRGQLVKSLVNENLEARRYQIVWDGKDDSNNDFSSGIYFYKLKNGSFPATRKMILLK